MKIKSKDVVFTSGQTRPIMCRTNLGVPVIGIECEPGTFPAEFYYIAATFGAYYPSEYKTEAIRFDTKEEVEVALVQINKLQKHKWKCYLYAPDFDENTQKFDESLDTLVEM